MTQEIDLRNLHKDEDDNIELRCDCGRRSFSIFYVGTIKRKLLETVIEPRKGLLIIKASCVNCRKIFKLYDSREGKEKNDYHFDELEFKDKKNVYGIIFKKSKESKVRIKGSEIIIYSPECK